MKDTLFRPDAVVHSQQRLAGEIILNTPASLRIGAVVCILIAIGGVAFLARATYARQETVTGWLVPHGGIIRIGTRSGGIVERLLVTEGAVVKLGQPVARIRLITPLAGGKDSGAETNTALALEAKAITDQAEAARNKLLREQTDLRIKLDQLREQLSEQNTQVGYQLQQIELAKTDVSRFERLVREGAMAERDLDSSRASLLSAEQTLAQHRASISATEQQMQDANTRLHAIPEDIATSRANENSQNADLTEKRIQTNAQNVDLVVASVSGRILALPQAQGQMLAPDAIVAVIAPAGSGLEAELYVPSRAVGFVKPGDEVKLMFQAFPHEKFGASKGSVISVSRTLLSTSEVTIPGLDEQKQPVFRVRAKLADQFQHAYGESYPLQPGMLLNASIIFDRRTLLQWLFDPIYAIER